MTTLHILIPAIIDIQKTAPNRLHQFIKGLSKKHKITVVCINDFWKARQVDTERNYQDFDEILKNVTIVYVTQKKTSPIMQEIFSPLFLRKLPDNGYDIIFNYNTLVSGAYLAKKFKIPMVYDIADDLPAMIRDSPQIPFPFGIFGEVFGEMQVKKTIKNSIAVTSITERFRAKYAISERKFHLIPNGVDTSLFKKVNSSIRSDLNLKEFFVIGYVGVLREWVDLTPVYESLKELINTKLLIVGREGLFYENQKKAEEFGVTDEVIFTGNIPYGKVPGYIAAMDVCLIPFKRNEITQNAVPLKLFEYMACEKPVISSRTSAVQEIVNNKIIYADTAKEYIHLLNSLIENRTSDEFLLNNRNFVVENYEWSECVEKIESLLKKIKEGK